jgi:LPXTG-site transpeptidase (sortase) family protein
MGGVDIIILMLYYNNTMTEPHSNTRVYYSSPAEKRLVFIFVFVGVLALTYAFFYSIDFLPEKPDTATSSPKVAALEVGSVPTTLSPLVNEEEDTEPVIEHRAHDGEEPHEGSIDPYPVRIVFDDLDGRTITVRNPESRSIEALDTALLSGVVRHPDSADFARPGTIFLFGHSSYLPNVINKNFQAFNGIQKMTWGDMIRLQSSDTEYVYRVDRVYEASALEAEVKIETGKAKLVLVTCDSFGAKSDRFVVEATLIESAKL